MNLRVSRGLTLALAGFAVLMLLVCLLMWIGFGRGYSWWPLDAADSSAGAKKFVNEQFRLGSWDKYAEVNERPLFNEDRKPTPPMAPEVGPAGTQQPQRALDVVLAGVIITPKVRMVLVKEKGKEKAMSIKEGAPMPGEWGSWNLIEVKPRSAVFKNSSGENATVELIAVATTQNPTPPPAPRDSASGAQTPPAPAPGQPPPPPPPPGGGEAGNAPNDLQQRIEARRQQIREQQQQQQQQLQQQQAQPPPGGGQPQR